MDVPKTWIEYAIWVGMQFPVVVVAAVVQYWVVREAKRYSEQVYAESRRLYEGWMSERDRRIEERDARIRQLEHELSEVRSRLSRSRKSEG